MNKKCAAKDNVNLVTDDVCTGCMACRNVCPVDAILSVQNSRGFYRPFIHHELCIECGKCRAICPQINVKEAKVQKQSYYAFKSSDSIRLESSSGGLFTWLSDYILEQGGVVFGCIVDQDLRIIHIGASDENTRNLMRGSKYVQSDVGLVYREIKKLLMENRKVLFSGTPCQCEGLLSYLGKLSEEDNLYTLDFICEGGASPFIYRDFLDYYQKKENIKIKEIYFRDKQRYQYKLPPILSRRLIVKGENAAGEDVLFYNRKINDRFHDCLFVCALQQKACEKCKFHSYNHCTDVTCGDFHRYKLDNGFHDDLGLSEILINSEKIERLLHRKNVSFQFIKCSKEDVWQPLLERNGKIWPFKNIFWKIYEKQGFEYASRLILLRIWRVKIQHLWGSVKYKIKKVI